MNRKESNQKVQVTSPSVRNLTFDVRAFEGRMKTPVSNEDLLALFDEQLDFIEASARSFDQGYAGEIKRLALSVRVLVHDTGKSTSLLQLTGKKGAKFVDSSIPFDEANKLSHSSLVQFRLSSGGTAIEPMLDGGPFGREIEFDNWWNGKGWEMRDVLHIFIFCLRSWFDCDSCLTCQDNHD
jgi:hypothetical protein